MIKEKNVGAGSVAQWYDCLICAEALGSISSTANNKNCNLNHSKRLEGRMPSIHVGLGRVSVSTGQPGKTHQITGCWIEFSEGGAPAGRKNLLLTHSQMIKTRPQRIKPFSGNPSISLNEAQ
jgi:hypothetical protein